MPSTPIPLQEALRQYDRQADRKAIEIAEQERQEIVKRFTIEAWPTMGLDRYALGLGNSQESFSWWLEFGTPNVGSIKGGNARKHGIFLQREDGQWYFDHKRFKTEQEAWSVVRQGFVEGFERAPKGDWNGIDQIDCAGVGPTVRTKSLYCYFPDDLLPISSTAHLQHFLRLLGHADVYSYGVIRLNRLLLETLRKTPGFEGWKNKEIEKFLYHWADPRDQRRIVKIAPGDNAKFWNECFDGEYICVGWGNVGDLRDYDSKETFFAKFQELYTEMYKGNRATVTIKAKEVWTLRELEPGDLIVANKGISHVLAVGTVVEPGYEYSPNSSDYRHHVHVKWDTSYEQDIPPQKGWPFVTVANIPQSLAAQILSKKPGQGPMPPIDPIYREVAAALERKGQVILYGPPGTGKTYLARRFVIWWLMKQMGMESPDLLTDSAAFTQAEQKLSTTQVVRRVWWAVANPKEWNWDRLFKEKRVSYGYGRLRRNYPLVRKGDLVMGYQATPDKRLVALARVSRELYTTAAGEQTIDLEPVARIDDGLTFEELQKDVILNNSEPIRCRNQGTLFALSEDEFDHLASLLTERNPDLRTHLEGADVVGPLTWLTFHGSYSYEDFIEGFRPVESHAGQLTLRLEDGIFKRVCREAQANPKKSYLVLIDEINRANVAKVFGELITLLEKDKRGLFISLPQSKESFTIPPNVYVLGTMNTADRSIKLLDTALRRRFAFVELMPDAYLLKGGKVGNLLLDDFLVKLNRRIASKEGREKQIGHSFLMDKTGPITDTEEFAWCFRQELLPLLQEYCYDDYRELSEYIGEELVDQEGQTLNQELLSDTDGLIAALEKEFNKEAETA